MCEERAMRRSSALLCSAPGFEPSLGGHPRRVDDKGRDAVHAPQAEDGVRQRVAKLRRGQHCADDAPVDEPAEPGGTT